MCFFILQNKSDVFKMKTTVNIFNHKFQSATYARQTEEMCVQTYFSLHIFENITASSLPLANFSS